MEVSGFNFSLEIGRVQVVESAELEMPLWSGGPVGDRNEESEGLPCVWRTAEGRLVVGYESDGQCMIFKRWPLANFEHARRAALWLTRKACT